MNLSKKSALLFGFLTLVYLFFIVGWFFFKDQYTQKDLLVFGQYSVKYSKVLVTLVASVPAVLWILKIFSIYFFRPINIPKIKVENNLIKTFLVFFIFIISLSTLDLFFRLRPNTSSEMTKKVFHPSMGISGMDLFKVGKLIESNSFDDIDYNVFLIGESNSAQLRTIRIQESINKSVPKGNKVKFFNLSMPWHSSVEAIYKLVFYVLSSKPDLIIYLPAINDLYRGCNDPAYTIRNFEFDYGNYLGPHSNLIKSHTRKFKLAFWDFINFKFFHKWFNDFRDLDDVYYLKYLPISDNPNEIYSYNSFRRNLGIFAKIVSTVESEVIFATSPTPINKTSNSFKTLFGDPVTKCKINGESILSEESFYEAYNKMYHQIEKVSNESGIDFVDLREMIKYKREDFSDLIHPREKLLTIVEDKLVDMVLKKYKGRGQSNAF